MNDLPGSKLLSIIIATKDSESSLRGLFDSILSSNLSSYSEILIADGSSTDNTLDIIDSYSNRLSIQICSTNDRGIYDAWNKCLSFVNGQWVCFLGDDDSISNLLDLSNLVFVLSSTDIKHKYDAIFCTSYFNHSTKPFYIVPRYCDRFLWKGFPFAHPASFVQSSIFTRNSFDSKYKIAADYKFFSTHSIRGLNLPHLVFSSLGADGVSTNNIHRIVKEIFLINLTLYTNPFIILFYPLKLAFHKLILAKIFRLFISHSSS